MSAESVPSAAYRIFGSEMSPYAVKVRSYFRYKRLPHVWIAREPSNDDEFRRHARLPIIPVVVTPDGEALQDSTPIIERVEREQPTPSINPDAPALHFLSDLLEEFGDEWGNKLMFHHRWWDDADQQSASLVLAHLNLPQGSPDAIRERSVAIRSRMTNRGAFVGSDAATAPLITRYLLELLAVLEAHLADRRYLFGGRPAFADFGLAAQLYEASVDPTGGGLIRARAPGVLGWCHRMLDPGAESGWEDWSKLAPTMEPLLAYVARYFLPWTAANARALAAGEESFAVDLPGGQYRQQPQKYHARSLSALQGKWAQTERPPELTALMNKLHAAAYLEA